MSKTMKSVKKFQIELTPDSGIRGVTVWFNDGTNWQGLPTDKDKIFAGTFAKINTVRLVDDFLKRFEEK
jgi:hypothetical protein